jgi:hypothetical protein
MPLLVRDGVDESQQLTIALLDAVNLAPREETAAQETDLALHASFLVASVGSAQAQVETPKKEQARTSERKSECTVVSKQNSPHMARDQASTMMKSQSERVPPPGTGICPTCAQST